MPEGPESESTAGHERIPTFEEQFANKEKIEALGGTIETVDIRPNTPKTEVPVIFAPGWSETPDVLKPSLETLMKSGRRTLSLSHPRSRLNAVPRSEYPFEEVRKAEALLALLEQKGIEKTDAIGHSEGGINIIIAAREHPEKFRNIILVGPGGLVGKDKFLSLVARFTGHTLQEAVRNIFEPGTVKRLALELGKKDEPRNFGGVVKISSAKARKRLQKAGTGAATYLAKNPSLALHEAAAISSTQIQEWLKELHDHGIGISIIHGVDDVVSPMERMNPDPAKQINPEKTSRLTADYIDGFYSVKGDHNEIFVQAEKYTKLADQALDDLEAKHENA